MATLDFFSTYHLAAVVEEIVPRASFFHDRYFPTNAGDIFNTDKVLVEYRDGDRKIAPFVAPRVGGIVVDRRGYSIHELTPAFIELSRTLTQDDLVKRGYGEAIYANSTRAQRAARLQLDDFTDMNNRILRREEWMGAQLLVNNSYDIQEYLDAETPGELLNLKFYEGDDSDHSYTPSATWDDGTGEAFFKDVPVMCRMLTKRGLPATDLVLGSEVGSIICDLTKVRELLDNRRMNFGSIDPKLTAYPGVICLGQLNFDGHLLTIFVVDETYENEDGETTSYFPTDGATVTAPGCGATKYGAITQIDYGNTEFTTHAKPRVPRVVIDQPKNIRKYNLASRPLVTPKNKNPYIFAGSVV